MYWTAGRKAEFEADCDRRMLRRDNPMPATKVALPAVDGPARRPSRRGRAQMGLTAAALTRL